MVKLWFTLSRSTWSLVPHYRAYCLNCLLSKQAWCVIWWTFYPDLPCLWASINWTVILFLKRENKSMLYCTSCKALWYADAAHLLIFYSLHYSPLNAKFLETLDTSERLQSFLSLSWVEIAVPPMPMLSKAANFVDVTRVAPSKRCREADVAGSCFCCCTMLISWMLLVLCRPFCFKRIILTTLEDCWSLEMRDFLVALLHFLNPLILM